MRNGMESLDLQVTVWTTRKTGPGPGQWETVTETQEILFCESREEAGLHIETDCTPGIYTASREQEEQLRQFLNRRAEARDNTCEVCGQNAFRKGCCPCVKTCETPSE